MRLLTLLALSLCLSGCAARAQTLPDVFPAIPEIRAVNHVAKVVLHVVGDYDTHGPQFMYGLAVGQVPTIRVEPGDTIAMTVYNDLPKSTMSPDTVNVHFHGLEVSPNAPGDEVLMTLARPGQVLHYRVHIPLTQEPGLYWYHPHAMPETYWQVSYGMSGVIVVEGMQRHFPALAAMKERIIVLRDVPTIGGMFDDLDDVTPAQLHRRANGAKITGPACRPETNLQPTFNREGRAVVGIAPGERQFFRVVNASAARYFDVAVPGENLQLVAMDGIALDAYPGQRSSQVVPDIVLPPAGRAEFIVTGQARPSLFVSKCFDAGPGGDADPAVVLADLRDPGYAQAAITGAPTPSPGPDVTYAPIELSAGQALPDNTMSQAAPAPAAQRRVVLSEVGTKFLINGMAFMMGRAPMFVARSGTVEEWNVYNKTDEVHAFHIHQVHFLLLANDGRDPGYRRWLDTVNVPPRSRKPDGTYMPGSVRILVDFRDPIVRGTLVFHCHILDHEDHGMMATIRVI